MAAAETSKLSLEEAKELRKENRMLAGEGINFNVKMINDNGASLRNISLSLATFLFVFSSGFLFQDISKVGICIKIIVFISWIFLILSICVGMYSFRADMKFHAKGLDREVKRDNTWAPFIQSVEDFLRREEDLKVLNLGQTQSSSDLPLIIQIASLLTAILLTMIAAGIYMFR